MPKGLVPPHLSNCKLSDAHFDGEKIFLCCFNGKPSHSTRTKKISCSTKDENLVVLKAAFFLFANGNWGKKTLENWEKIISSTSQSFTAPPQRKTKSVCGKRKRPLIVWAKNPWSFQGHTRSRDSTCTLLSTVSARWRTQETSFFAWGTSSWTCMASTSPTRLWTWIPHCEMMSAPSTSARFWVRRPNYPISAAKSEGSKTEDWKSVSWGHLYNWTCDAGHIDRFEEMKSSNWSNASLFVWTGKLPTIENKFLKKWPSHTSSMPCAWVIWISIIWQLGAHLSDLTKAKVIQAGLRTIFGRF